VNDAPETCDIPVWNTGYRDRCDMRLDNGECPRHGRRGGGFTRALVEDYFRLKGQPGPAQRDPWYQYEVTLLTDMLSRLEVILDDEGVDRGTARRVIRCMLYGAPSPAAAEQRMRQEQEMIKLLNERPPTVHVKDIDKSVLADLGLPPR
jgi:hypothetical protein